MPVGSGLDKCDNFVCDSYGFVVAALAVLTEFRVEMCHLERHHSSVRGVVLVGRQRS
ncbi:DUF7558 family protein [Halobaculum magnesiiphilum]|uniref:DUF7558 family protein n=1 Tax=Halobaculum magnesiiphilum TaxID=1017351 RepID=UPI003CE4F07C